MYGNDQGYGQGGSDGFVPVNVGDEIEVTIEAVGAKGDGICKKDGFVLFVPDVREGDRVTIKVTKVLRKVGFAEVVSRDTAAAPAKEQAQATEEQTYEEAPMAAEPSAEDSEDFGEEPAKEEPEADDEEEPEEEKKEE